MGIFEYEINRKDKQFLRFLETWSDSMRKAEAKNKVLARKNEVLFREKILKRIRQREAEKKAVL
jgi:hypothetical protein